MKKIICLLITICLTLSCLLIPINAQVKPDSAQNEAIESMSSNNVVEETLEYTSPIYSSNILISSSSQNITYNLDISNKLPYDKIEVSFSSTLNVLLNDYSTRVFNYSENLSIPIIFSAIVNDDSDLQVDYRSTYFDKIIINYTVFVNDKAVENKVVEVSVLSTVNGIFVGNTGNMTVYDTYINYLHSLKIIDTPTFLSAQHLMTSPSLSFDTSSNEENYVKSQLSSSHIQPTEVRCWNKSTNSTIVTTEQLFCEDSAIKYAKESSMVMPLLLSNTNSRIRINYEINSVTGSSNLIISGSVKWTDIETANPYHAMRNVRVSIMDKNALSNATISTTYTDNYGSFSATITNNTSLLEGGYDIFLKIDTIANNYTISSPGILSSFYNGYYLTTSPIQNVTTSISSKTEIFTDPLPVQAFQIHQALNTGYYYYNSMTSNNATNVTVRYPSDEDNSLAYPQQNLIKIYSSDFASWDTILHELGHIAQYNLGAVGSFSEHHYITENLIESYGVSKGAAGSWSEGWATFFGLTAQEYYNDRHPTIEDIFSAADQSYTNITLNGTTLSKSTFSMNTEYKGEGNEMAVAFTLFNIIYDVDIDLSTLEIWQLIDTNNPTRFSHFMEDLYNYVSPDLISPIGDYLERYNIAISAKNNNANYTSLHSVGSTPKLFWSPVNTVDGFLRTDSNGNPISETILSYTMKVVFFDENYNVIYTSPSFQQTSLTSPLQVDPSQWVTIVSNSPTGICYWGIITEAGGDNGSIPYYSSLKKIVRTEFVQSLTLNTVTIKTLSQNHELWFSFTATSSGNHVFYSANSPDIKAKLFTDTIFEDNQATQSDDDSGGSYNFAITHYMNAGDTIYLKVQGYNEFTNGVINVYVRQ